MVLIFLAYLMVVLGLQVFTGNSGVISFGHVGVHGDRRLHGGADEPQPVVEGGPDRRSAGLHQERATSRFLPATLIAIVVHGRRSRSPFGFIFARLSGTAAAIATLAGYEIAITVIANWDTVTHGTFTLYGIPSYSYHELFWWSLGWAVVGHPRRAAVPRVAASGSRSERRAPTSWSPARSA